MTSKLFVDTGAFLARAISADGHHSAASRLWEELAKNSIQLYSSEHVLDETLTLLARRAGYGYAASWGELHLESQNIRWLSPRSADLTTALRAMRKYADQAVSFTDCVSSVLMRREGIKRVFTFDRHFGYMGFSMMTA
jgi:predicted nucleic acid-binding protein